MVTQFMGGTYDTNNYPYVLLNPRTKEVHARFSTLQKGHEGRLMHSINHQEEIGVMLYNEKTKRFIDWQKKDRIRYEKYKDNPSLYFENSSRTIKRR